MTFRRVLTRAWKAAPEADRDDLVLYKSTGERFRAEERDIWIKGAGNVEGIEFLDGGELAFSNDADKAAQIAGLLKATPQSSIWTISTDNKDRMRDTIDVGGWDTKAFKQNPVVLWAHQSRELPVAKVLQLWTDTKGKFSRLRAIKQFTTEEQHPFGAMVWRLTEDGFLGAASVGFRRLKSIPDPDDEMGLIFKKQELLESSVVPIPANPFALEGAKGIDLSPYIPWCERALDGEEMFMVPREHIERVYMVVRGGPKSVTVSETEAKCITEKTEAGGKPHEPKCTTCSDTRTTESPADGGLMPCPDCDAPQAQHCKTCTKVVLDKDAITHEGKAYCATCEPDAVKLARLVAEAEQAKAAEPELTHEGWVKYQQERLLAVPNGFYCHQCDTLMGHSNDIHVCCDVYPFENPLTEEQIKAGWIAPDAPKPDPTNLEELLECLDTLELEPEPDEDIDLDTLTPEALKQMVSAAMEATP